MASIYGILNACQKAQMRTLQRMFEAFFDTKSQVARWLPPLLWAAVIFTFSSLRNPVVSQFFVWDYIAKKIAHVTEYAILFLLILRATKKNWILSILLTIAYAVTDEFHQSFIPGRTPAIYDIGLDTSGANIAGYIIWKLKPRQRRQLKK